MYVHSPGNRAIMGGTEYAEPADACNTDGLLTGTLSRKERGFG
jgi:hypothetical protein